MMSRVKNKLYCIAWLLLHGFIPQKYYWRKRFKFLYTTHNYFSYDKFQFCGKVCKIEKPTWKQETVEVNEVWDFPKGMIK